MFSVTKFSQRLHYVIPFWKIILSCLFFVDESLEGWYAYLITLGAFGLGVGGDE